MREGVVFYKSFLEAINLLPEEEQLKAFRSIVEYGIYGTEPSLDGVAGAVFLLARPQIDANNRRYENGKRGGRPKKSGGNKAKSENLEITEGKPRNNLDKTERKPKEKVKDKDKVKEKDKEKEKSLLDKTIDNYREHRKQIKAPMTDQAYKLMLNKLESLSGGREDIKIAILNQSIENGWKGIFELKDRMPAAKFNNEVSRGKITPDLERELLGVRA